MARRLVGYWTVQAGRITGEPLPEKVRQFNYTSDMQKEDGTNRGAEESHFHRLRNEVFDYAKEVSNPGEVKWLRVEYMKM